MENKKLTCKRCGESFSYDSKDTYFDDHGYGYSTKLVKCSHCNTPNVIKHHEDKWLDVNNDEKYYIY